MSASARAHSASLLKLSRCIYADDEQFKEEKAVIIKEISTLEPNR
jgi:hypothetical protein